MSDRNEWLAAVNAMTEMELAATELEVRRTEGICGDRDDALYD